MKRITLSAFIVLALISIDATISMAYAESNITIFKVTKVSTRNKLQLRAWPSPKSRIKISLPYNAVDLTETGKKKILGKTKWLEVNWKENRGWVNARYLKKTGVLPGRRSTQNNAIASSSSRNINSNAKALSKSVVEKAKAIRRPSVNAMPPMPTENRYSQPTQIVAAREVKTAYSTGSASIKDGKILRCVGSSPQTWSITMDVANKKNAC